MSKNILNAVVAVVATTICGYTWANPSVDLSSFEVPVGYAKVVKISGDGNSYTLGVGTSSSTAQTWSGTYIGAELEKPSLSGSQSVMLAVAGKAVTSSTQSFNVYAKSSEYTPIELPISVTKVVEDSILAGATDCGDVFLSLGRVQVLTNVSTKAAIKWSNVDMFKTEDADIAKLVQVGEYVAISNAVCDGEADVVIVTKTGGYKLRYGVKATTVTIEKTVVPSTDANDKSNALIRIVTHVLNKPKPRPPKVLFFGTGCGAHELKASEMITAINAISKVGSVDWYFFKNWSKSNKGLYKSGSIAYNGTELASGALDDVMGSASSGNHYSLKAFYDQFEAIINDAVKSNYYDYVVIETDGSRVANEYGTWNGTSTSADDQRGGKRDTDQEWKVAKWLKPFYDNGKIIWIMDDGYDYKKYFELTTSSTYTGTDENLFRYGTGFGLYRANNVSLKNSGGSGQWVEMLTDAQWEGFKGIFDPASYLNKIDFEVSYSVKIKAKSGTDTVTTKATYTNPNQLFYHHESEIGGELQQIITPVSYETDMADTVLNLKNLASADTVVIPNGLGSVRLYTWSWPGGQSPTEVDPTQWQADVGGWTEDLAKTGLSLGGFTISNRVQNITNDCWRKVEIGIQFKEDFLETAKARKDLEPEWTGIEWNEEKKVYEVNPNEGEAVVTLWRGAGESRVRCMATAQATALALEMKDDQKKFNIKRAESVTKTYDGVQTNIVIEVNEPPIDMTIKYRNKGGSDTEWKDYTTPGAWPYVTVADSTNVEFKIEAKNYKTYVGTNNVVITAAPIVPPAYNPPPAPGEPGPGPGPEPQTEPDGPWAAAYNVEKDYDGLGTNVIFTYGHIDVKPTFKFAYYSETAPDAGSSAWKDYSDFFTNVTYASDKKTVKWEKVWVRVTAGDNYVATNLYAHVKIKPKNLGGGGGDDNAIVADDQSIAYGKALPTLTWHGGKGLVDGDGVEKVELALTNGVDASTLPKGVYPDIISTNAAFAQAIVITNSVGADVTDNYTGFFTPGKLTVVAGGMEIGPEGPAVHPPAGEPPMPPADPDDEGSWTNGARSVTKTYDGKATNIVVTTVKPSDGVIRYSYDGVTFYDKDKFPGYTTVTNRAPVWYEASDPAGNYRAIKNRAFVTIEKKNLGGGGDDNAIVADDKSIAYGDACPMLTWHGGKGLAPGDFIQTVSLALKDGAVASKLPAGVYPGLITTNAAVVIVNPSGVDVTDCYEGFFTAGKFTVNSATIRYEIDVPNVPYDGKGTNVTVKLISESDPPFILKYRGPDTPEGVWLDTPPVYTNASPYDVTYLIEDGDNFTPVTNTVTMIISPRKITLKSPNKEKIYDANPLQLFADEIAAGGMGFADGERFDFTNLAEITLPGTVKATFAYGSGTAVLANYEVTEVEYGKLRVNPNDEQILVRSASGSWTYDGAAHGTNDYVIVGEKNLYEGDWVLAELKGNTVTTPDEGDVTNAFKTVEIYRGPKGDVAHSAKVTSEYKGKLLRDEGLLNVVNAKFADPVVTAYRGLYDGLDHGIFVEKPQVPGGTANVDYPDGNLFRDVTNAVVRFVISAQYYDDYVGESTVEILPREVVFTTGDDIKKYGAIAETPADIKVGGDGFITGEGYSVTELDQRSEVGRSDAGFDYNLTGGAKSGNYQISMVKGSLTVYDDKKLTVIATNAVHVFDGNEYYNHDVTIENLPAGCTATPVFAASSVITYPGEVANRIATVKIMKGVDDVTTDYETVLIDGKLKVVAAKLEGGEVVSTNVVYDGVGHSIKVTAPSYKGTGPATIYYSTTGWDGPYQSENPSFTLADPKGTPNEVYVRISVPGYEDYYTNGFVTVTRRPVTIASESAEKTYDGAPLTKNVVGVSSAIKLAEGDELVATTTASQTNAGETDNVFGYKIMDAATKSIERTKNYHVTIENGVLTVNPAPIPPWNPKGPGPGPGPGPGDEPEGPWVWLDDATMVYTGAAGTNATVTSGHFADGLPKLEYRPEGTLKFLPFAQAFTNVMYDAEGNYRSTNVTVRFTGDANYLSTNLTAKVTVLPGSIVLGPDGPTVYPPAGRPPMPPADPNDPASWTNGARSVTKTYDGVPTNIVVTADTPADATITYSYDKTDWKPYETFPGYTEVTNRATVWFKVEAVNYQTITNRAFVTIKPKSLGPKLDPHPKDPKHPYVPEEGIVIPDLPSDIYDGDPYEPVPAVTNTLVKGAPPELEEGKDYTIEYFNNTNATEEAFVVITGIGNYGGCYTNYFTILPRQVTLRSGTKEMYLTEPPTTLVCSNFFVWVEQGSFVTNAVTGREDGFVPTVTKVLVSAVPAGPIVNDFTVEADPLAFATNYNFTLKFGRLAIYSSPTNRHDETHEQIPSEYGGVVDAVMDNNDAGPYAADKPKEFNDEAAKLVKDPTDKVEFRMILSTNYVESSYVAVSNKIVAQAFAEGHAKGWDDKRIQHDIDKYGYDIFDIAVRKIHTHCDSEGEMLNVETNDWGNNVSQLLTIRIPYAFNPKLIGFSVWRNHTNGTEAAGRVVELPYYGTVAANQESWQTNSTEVVLRVQKFSVYVFKSVYLSTPRLAGRIRWKYHRAQSTFFAGLDVVCTNGDKEVISDLCYIFEDRADWYLRVPERKNMSHLSDDPNSRVVYGGKRFAKVPLLGVQAELRANDLCTTSHYGVAESTFSGAEYGSRYVVPTEAEMLIALTTTKLKELATSEIPPEVNPMLGYLTWKEEGYDEVFWCALGEGMEPINTAAFGMALPPLTLAQANYSAGYGVVPLADGSEPTLEIAQFLVEGRRVSGLVRTTNGVQTGAPSSAAKLTILGASSLTDGFVEIAYPELSSDGSFEFEAPADVKFFKAKLQVTAQDSIK